MISLNGADTSESLGGNFAEIIHKAEQGKNFASYLVLTKDLNLRHGHTYNYEKRVLLIKS